MWHYATLLSSRSFRLCGMRRGERSSSWSRSAKGFACGRPPLPHPAACQYPFQARLTGKVRTLLIRRLACAPAVPFLQEVELGKRPKLPKSIKRQSLNEMAAFVAGEAGKSEPQNVESRVWRPSLARRSSGGRCLDHRFLPCSRWWNDYYGDHRFRTLTPLILVRIQVPQPYTSLI